MASSRREARAARQGKLRAGEVFPPVRFRSASARSAGSGGPTVPPLPDSQPEHEPAAKAALSAKIVYPLSKNLFVVTKMNASESNMHFALRSSEFAGGVAGCCGRRAAPPALPGGAGRGSPRGSRPRPPAAAGAGAAGRRSPQRPPAAAGGRRRPRGSRRRGGLRRGLRQPKRVLRRGLQLL